jgi:hypothetical protein
LVVSAPLAVIAPLLVSPDKVGVVIVGEVAKTAKPVPVAAFQLGAVLKDPVPVCVSTAIAEEVLPASITVVPGALWYGIEPRSPPGRFVADEALPMKDGAVIDSVVVIVVPLSVKEESVAVLLVVRLRITLAVAVPTVWITVAGSCAIEAEPPIWVKLRPVIFAPLNCGVELQLGAAGDPVKFPSAQLAA